MQNGRFQLRVEVSTLVVLVIVETLFCLLQFSHGICCLP